MKTITLYLLTIILSVSPRLVSAQPPSSFYVCEGSGCNFCHILQLGNTLVTWLIAMLFIIFGIMAFSAGIKLVTSGGNTSAVESAKKQMTNAFVGIIIVLGAWLLIDTILKGVALDLTKFGAGFGPWNQIQCGVQN